MFDDPGASQNVQGAMAPVFIEEPLNTSEVASPTLEAGAVPDTICSNAKRRSGGGKDPELLMLEYGRDRRGH